MFDVQSEILKHAANGLCCSQITVKMVGLDPRGEENPDLIKAMQAYCYGLYGQLTCGVLLGCAAALSLYTETKEETSALVLKLNEWFEEENGSCSCEDILGKGCPPTPICRSIMEKSINKCFELLEDKL